MREILFRGKTSNTGEWIVGDYEHFYLSNGELVVYISDWGKKAAQVITETVGQYTGLTDKNGTKIFEGDIVKGTFLGFPMPVHNYILAINWQEDVAGWRANYFEDVEVIGNIHDNPELLEVSENA